MKPPVGIQGKFPRGSNTCAEPSSRDDQEALARPGEQHMQKHGPGEEHVSFEKQKNSFIPRVIL